MFEIRNKATKPLAGELEISLGGIAKTTLNLRYRQGPRGPYLGKRLPLPDWLPGTSGTRISARTFNHKLQYADRIGFARALLPTDAYCLEKIQPIGFLPGRILVLTRSLEGQFGA
jgi:hypothetical protein